MHHCLRGMDAPVLSFTFSITSIYYSSTSSDSSNYSFSTISTYSCSPIPPHILLVIDLLIPSISFSTFFSALFCSFTTSVSPHPPPLLSPLPLLRPPLLISPTLPFHHFPPPHRLLHLGSFTFSSSFTSSREFIMDPLTMVADRAEFH